VAFFTSAILSDSHLGLVRAEQNSSERRLQAKNTLRNFNLNQRWTTVLLVLFLSLPVHANAHKSDTWAHDQFATAEHKRQALNNLPPDQQNRREYQNVIDSYRRVYYGCPTSSKADASVFAVADILGEMGRHFQDASFWRSAIAQYEFLRREYPGSKYRFDALLNVGHIYGDDLNDTAHATKTFEDFIRQYPRNHLAADARASLANFPEPGPKTKEDGPAKNLQVNSRTSPASDLRDAQRPVSANQTVVPEDSGKPPHIIAIHHWSGDGHDRVAIDFDHVAAYKSQRIENPDRIFFDLDAQLSRRLIGKTLDVDDDLLKKIRVAQFQPKHARIVLEIGEHSDFSVSVETNPSRLIIDIKDSQIQTQGLQNKDVESSKNLSREEKHASAEGQASKALESPHPQAASLPTKRIVEADDDDPSTVAKISPPTSLVPKSAKSSPFSSSRSGALDHLKARGLDIREAQPTASGDRSLIRALGLKIGKIVIDPGHGGHDTGTIGPNSLLEKDLVLDVSRRLGKLLESRLGAQVVYTRKDDTFIPLETRTAIANQEQADLFVSVHANSSHDPAARGVETYYLNFSSSPDALEVAARENAVSETSIHELQDLVKQIALKEKIEESREFASDVQQELHSGLSARNPGLRDRGVKKAPFIVLIGANMPSILAEISFVSNPGDERRLETAAYRQKIAESLYRGISKYVSGLSGVKVASRIEKTSGQ
jgi:N-acetylmuramoyl-L-alanine amidase